jgi:signal peptidase I
MNENIKPRTGWWKRIVVGADLKTTLRRAILLALFCILLFNYVLLPVQVRGNSMEPTYRDGSPPVTPGAARSS